MNHSFKAVRCFDVTRLKHCAVLASTFAALSMAAAPAEAAKLGCAINGITPEFGVNYAYELDSDQTWEYIEGDPLMIVTGSEGTIQVYVCQPEQDSPQYQYYSEGNWGTAIWLNGEDDYMTYATNYFDGNDVTPVSQTKTTSGGKTEIETIVTLGSDAELRRVVTYNHGASGYKIHWELTNTSGVTQNDLRFFHGGDTYFGGDDSARSWWNEDLNMVYVNNESFDVSGTMAFRGLPATSADRYFSGNYSDGRDLVDSGELDNSSNPYYEDAGYYLQWNRASLAAGATWIIEAFESWTDPTFVSVLAPAAEDVTANSTITLSFFVHNLDTESHTFDLTAESDQGWPTAIVGSQAATLEGLAQTLVDVQVQVPIGTPPDTLSRITLTAEAPAEEDAGGPVSGSSSTDLTVFQPNYSLSSSDLAFGTRSNGSTTTLTLTFNNAGSAAELGTVGSPNGLASPFSITTDNCSGQTIAYGESCTVEVQFAPSVDEADFEDSFNFPVLSPLTASLSVSVTGSAGPTCDDEAANGDESDVDCGGSLCEPCADSLGCGVADDCVSGVCADDVCQAPTCEDGAKNADETDVDCGGTCQGCADSLACVVAGDCVSGVCSSDVCQAGTCSDSVKNADETDVDCGGSCSDCVAGLVCAVGGDCLSGVCSSEICQAPSCSDTVANGDETDVDCGGSCDSCADGLTCVIAGDCTSGLCDSEVCLAATCGDSVKNSDETDVDCGGSCGGCAAELSCLVAGDCMSGVCSSDVCQEPTCSDSVKNGDETDVDCGGSCDSCANGLVCAVAGDCTSGVCNNETCEASTCNDSVKNGDETDVDCGGSSCDSCANGLVCAVAGDCTSGVCNNETCEASTCSDSVENGDETDVDCGGSCGGCANGLVCAIAGDCTSGVCDETCQAATCTDGVENGDETDVDCGGSCDACGTEPECEQPADCASGVCNDGVCAEPTCDDGTANGTETDVDCGGSCSPCAVDLDCSEDSDCESGVCTDGVCVEATCGDGVKNTSETDVDCGGDCGGCDIGLACVESSDCTTDVCDEGECQAPTCDDDVKNGDEDDVDCGGNCESCEAPGCTSDDDCESNVCDDGTCMAATCTDGVKNGDEDDVDCGGECEACVVPSKGSFVGGTKGCTVAAAGEPSGRGQSWLWLMAAVGATVIGRRSSRKTS